jgi:DNA-binding HxlR family transcriptional regulator
MKLEEKVSQLTELLADLIPTVDRLAQVADRNQKSQEKSTREFQEMRLSNMKLAESIERIVLK